MHDLLYTFTDDFSLQNNVLSFDDDASPGTGKWEWLKTKFVIWQSTGHVYLILNNHTTC